MGWREEEIVPSRNPEAEARNRPETCQRNVPKIDGEWHPLKAGGASHNQFWAALTRNVRAPKSLFVAEVASCPGLLFRS